MAAKTLLFTVLADETKTCMQLLGVEKISDLGPEYVSSISVKLISTILPGYNC